MLLSTTAAAMAIALVACGTRGTTGNGGSTAQTAASGQPGQPPATLGGESSPDAEPGASGSITQTDTEWGRIWDALPPSFPLPLDAVPAETRDGPVTAQFAVGASVEDLATFMQAALEGARYSTESMSNPVEDGTVVIESVGDTPECRVETRLTPLSGTTLMTIRFGAACPFG